MRRRKKPQKKIEKTCLVCGKTYLGYRGQKYCSKECSKTAQKNRLKKKKWTSEPEFKSILEVDPKDGKLKWRKVPNV